MSRCFPFPRSGYTGKISSNDSLIFSIKLQEGRENTIPDRALVKVKASDKKKDTNKEKKEKKNGQKDTKREKEIFNYAVQSEKPKQNDKLNKADGVRKERKAKRSFELLEQSNLTEEHGRPVDVQNASCSSGSTGNSSKRQRHSSPGNSIAGKRNIIRIRFSSKGRDGPSTLASIPHEDHSTSQSKVRPLSITEPSNSQKDFMSNLQEPSIGQKQVISNAQESSIDQKNVLSKASNPSLAQKQVTSKRQKSSLGLKDTKPKVRQPFIPPKEVVPKAPKQVVPKAQESVPVPSTSTSTLRSAYEKKIESLAPREGPPSSGRIGSIESPKVQQLFITPKEVVPKAPKEVVPNAQESVPAPSTSAATLRSANKKKIESLALMEGPSSGGRIGSIELPKVQQSFIPTKEVVPKALKLVVPKFEESVPPPLISTATSWSAYGKKIESLAPREGPSSSRRIKSSESPSKKISSHEKKMIKIESTHTKLFENLTPPKLESEFLFAQDDDDDWLFGKKDVDRPAKRLKGGSDVVQANVACSSSAVLQPRAHFLPDVGIYALPFIIPF